MIASEITVVVKDEEKNLRYKYLIYEKYSVDPEDPIIKDCVEKAIENFAGEPTDVIVKIHLEIE